MPRHLGFLAAPLVWLITTVSLCAQTALLDAIPDNVLGLAVVDDMRDASARVQKVAQKMNLPVPELLPMAKMFSGAQLGVDDNGAIALVALAGDDKDATWGMSFAAFVPVTDYAVFIKQFDPKDPAAVITEVSVMGQSYLAAKKGGFAVLCGTDQTDLLKSILASTKNVAGTLAPLGTWLAEQQAAIVVTPAGKKRLFQGIGGLFGDAGKLPANDDGDKADRKPEDKDESELAARMRAGQEMIQSLGKLFVSSEPQVALLALGIRIDDQTALHVTARVPFTTNGALSQWAEAIEPRKDGLLAGLPAGKYVVAWGGVAIQLTPESSKLIELMTNPGLKMLGLQGEQRKKYFAIVERYRANQLAGCGVLGPLRPGDSITGTSAGVERVKDAKEHIKLTRDLFQMLKDATRADSKLATYEINEITIGDLKAIELITDMSAMLKEMEAAGPGGGAMSGLMSGMFGGDGKTRAYFAAADDSHLVYAYSKPLLQRGIEHVRSGAAGLEADPEIIKTAGLLPSGAQWAAFASPQGLVQWADTLMRQVLPAEMKIKIPAFPKSDPIGLAAKVSASQLDAEIVLSESVLAGIGQYVGLVQQMMQGGAAPLP